jgi:hypothetical protein
MVHAPPPFCESISWIISPFKFWTATIFLHAHLQVVYYICVKFHKNPISRLRGVRLQGTWTDGQTDGWTDGRADGRTGCFLYTPQTLFAGGIIIDDTVNVTSLLFRKSFNCRYNPRMDYVFCLLTLKSSEKWRSLLFGATCNFNDQILPYGILFLAFINTDVFYLLSFKFSR